MPTPVTGEVDYKWIFDVRVQPIDLSAILPAGILIGSVAVSTTPDTALSVGYAVRVGNKIVDIVYGVGTAQTYTVIVDITGDNAIGGQTWKQRVKFAVVVQS